MLTGKKFGRYEIRSKIGAGGMGEVYSAVDTELGRSVAVKVLPAEFTDDESRRYRFRKEARVISALNHPNIITIYEIGENEHGAFLATEFVDGQTLRDVLHGARLPLIKALRIAEQAANALVAAHAAGIVHRDIKPENIMVRSDGIVKVLDFGLAKSRTSAIEDGDGNLTSPGTVMGSARYMSPEQARGHEVDEGTDVWSLGVVLYEMLAGRDPFHSSTTADTLAAVIHKEPEPIAHLRSDLPPDLARIIRRSLQKDREERYQTMKDLSLDIKDLIYELEHSLSGERQAHTTSSPEFTENPTIIHTTTGGGQAATQVNSAPTAGTSPVLTASSPKKRSSLIAWAIAGILILSAGGFGIYRMTLSGGRPAASTFERTQALRLNSDGKVRMPSMSPDGKYITYLSGEVGNRSLVVRQLSTESEIVLVPPTPLGFAAVTFSPTGDYVYYTQTSRDFSLNTLYQVPTLGGQSKLVIEDVDSRPTFSPDGKTLAFRRQVSERNEDVIFTVNADGSGLKELIAQKKTGFDFFTSPAWSPKSPTILIGAGKVSGGISMGVSLLEVSLADGSYRTINTKEFTAIDSMEWLRDGSGLLLVAKEKERPMQLWRMSYPEGDVRPVTNDSNVYSGLGISADGSQLITAKTETVSAMWKFTPATKAMAQLGSESPKLEGGNGIVETPDGHLVYSSDEGFDKNIWISDADGRNAKRLTADAEINQTPVVTPDGKYIVFNSSRSGSFRVWRMDIDGKNPVMLTEESSQSSDFNISLTSDGQKVIFNRNFTGQVSNSLSTIFSVPVAGGPTTVVLSDTKFSNFGPQVSPDGKQIVYTNYNISTYERRILTAPFDGEHPGPVQHSFTSNLVSNLQWSPDSKSFTYLGGEGIPNLMRISLDGDKPTPITDFKSGRIFNYRWSRDGKSIFLVRGIVNGDLILIRNTSAVNP